MIQQNPRLANNALQDPRMIDVLGALMGIDLQASTRPEGSDEFPSGMDQDPIPPSYSASPQAPTPSTSKPKLTPEPTPAEEDVEMGDDDETRAKKEADIAKEAGSVAYKNRNFEEAAKQFQLAWDTWPKNVAYLTNLGAVYFEQGDYDKAIETCEKAIEEGRSLRADYKLIAKAYGRIGSAYQKKNDLESAIKFYQKSLTEDRTRDILNKVRDLEKLKAEEDRKAYIDVEKKRNRSRGRKRQIQSWRFRRRRQILY